MYGTDQAQFHPLYRKQFFCGKYGGYRPIITASLAGFAFAKMRFRGSALLFALLLATTMIPVEVTSHPRILVKWHALTGLIPICH